MEDLALLKKYNVAAPRYTSYPTVPYWDTEDFTQEKYTHALIALHGRYGEDGSKAVFQMLTEQNPTLDSTMYLNILVEPSRLPTAPQTCITEW